MLPDIHPLVSPHQHTISFTGDGWLDNAVNTAANLRVKTIFQRKEE